MSYDYVTAVFSAEGEDAGIYYGYQDWSWAKEKGKEPTMCVGSAGAGHPGEEFEEAVTLWCTNHEFKLPG